MLDVSRDKVPTMDDALPADRRAGLAQDQPAAALRRAHLRVPRAPRGVGRRVSADRRRDRGARRLLPPTLHRAGPQSELVRPHGALAEAPGVRAPGRAGGAHRRLHVAVPHRSRSIDLLAGLYDDLLPHFTSRSLNVGCDETIDLGKGRSREAVERLGRGEVYLEFVKKIHALVDGARAPDADVGGHRARAPRADSPAPEGRARPRVGVRGRSSVRRRGGQARRGGGRVLRLPRHLRVAFARRAHRERARQHREGGGVGVEARRRRRADHRLGRLRALAAAPGFLSAFGVRRGDGVVSGDEPRSRRRARDRPSRLSRSCGGDRAASCGIWETCIARPACS